MLARKRRWRFTTLSPHNTEQQVFVERLLAPDREPRFIRLPPNHRFGHYVRFAKLKRLVCTFVGHLDMLTGPFFCCARCGRPINVRRLFKIC